MRVLVDFECALLEHVEIWGRRRPFARVQTQENMSLSNFGLVFYEGVGVCVCVCVLVCVCLCVCVCP